VHHTVSIPPLRLSVAVAVVFDTIRLPSSYGAYDLPLLLTRVPLPRLLARVSCKIVQYISLIKPDSERPETSFTPLGLYGYYYGDGKDVTILHRAHFAKSGTIGRRFPDKTWWWGYGVVESPPGRVPPKVRTYLTVGFVTTPHYMRSPGFATEFEGGHGSHTAGTAAGAILDSPPELDCGEGEELSCFGGCFESAVLNDAATNAEFNIKTFCPAFDCDGLGDGHPLCFDDAVETLTTNGGVAQGAKISVFDVISDDSLLVYAFVAENGLWDAVEKTGCKVHSNSWGTTGATCATDVFTVAYDGYMYEVGER